MFDGQNGDFIEILVEDDPDTPFDDESGGLSAAHGLRFGPDGNLYVASFGTNQVLRFDGQSGLFTDVFVAAGNGLSGPTAIRFQIPGDLDG